MIAHQALGHIGQEEPGFRALDDPVVVGGGDGHRLADSQVGQSPGIGRLEASRDSQRPDTDDETLSGQESGNRLYGSQRSRIGQGHGGTGEVIGADLVGANLAHQLLVGADEPAEVQRIGIGDAGDQERAAAVPLFDVHRQPKSHMTVSDHTRGRLTIGVGDERGVHRRQSNEPFDHRIADQMGETDLASGRPEELIVDDGPIDLEQLGGNHPDAGGRGYAQRSLHVGHNAARRAS